MCSADFTRMVLLDRETLGVVARYDRPEWPLRWIGPERLLISGGRTVGVWDPAAQRFVWRADRAGGGFPWRDRVVTWASDSELEIRGETGEVERTIDLGTRGVGWVMPCGDVLLHKTPDSGDPVRAVHLADGRVQWTRNLLAEINQRHPAKGRDPAAPLTPGSMPDRFIVTREGAMVCCSLTDGAILWTDEVKVAHHWPLIVDGRIPVLNNGRFTVTDEATGTLLVDRRHPELSGMFREKQGSILGDLVVFASESTHLAAFDLRTGDLVYVKEQKNVGFWGTAVADGRLLASGTDGNIWVYEAK